MNEGKNGNPIFKIVSVLIVIAIVGFGIYAMVSNKDEAIEVHEIHFDSNQHSILNSQKLEEVIEHMKQVTFHDDENSLLITLDTKASALKDSIVNYIKEHFKDDELSVLIQVVDPNVETEKIANDYNISTSKASLIQMIEKNDPSLTLKDLSKLSINDLFILLYHQNHPNLIGIPSLYKTQKEIKDILMKDLNISEDRVYAYQMNYGVQDERLIIIATIKTESENYTYVLDPKTGSILNKSEEGNALITPEEATSIALKNANVSDVIDLDVEFKQSSEYSYYEVEFEANQKDYNYAINAKDGTIIQSNFERD